jgi:hypothetical protein
LLKNKNF